jgi:hypothetical protein
MREPPAPGAPGSGSIVLPGETPGAIGRIDTEARPEVVSSFDFFAHAVSGSPREK